MSECNFSKGREVIVVHNPSEGSIVRVEYSGGHTYILKNIIKIHTFLFTSLIPSISSTKLSRDVVIDEDEFNGLLNLLEKEGYVKRTKQKGGSK